MIEVTGSYLGLDQDVRGCQDNEPIQNCTSRCYKEALLKACGCLPFNIRLSDKVVFTQIISTFNNIYLFSWNRSPFVPQRNANVWTKLILILVNVCLLALDLFWQALPNWILTRGNLKDSLWKKLTNITNTWIVLNTHRHLKVFSYYRFTVYSL